MKMVYNDGMGMRFMGEYIRGVVVKLHLTPEQKFCLNKTMVVLVKPIMNF